MRQFMEPQSVALIGVPRQAGSGTFNNAETMIRYGYKGRLYPINPNAQEICGLKAYPTIQALPEVVDLAVISVGRDRVLPMFNQCIQAGVKRVVIISQGFADADERGREMQSQLVKLARENGVRIMGPNTMGVLNNYRQFTTAFIDIERPKVFSPVSIIAQTGVIQVASKNMAYKHWGKAIDIGNGCDVDTVDALSYFADDPETRIICIYMEGLTQGKAFLKAAGEASFKKPVIVFKSGRSQVGAKAALSHTGSLVGEDHVFDAAFKRSGVLRIKSATELKDAIHALLLLQEMKGPRLGVLTITGAGGIMTADACEDFGLTLSKLPEGLTQRLRQGIPDWIPIGNPIDIWPVGMIGGNYREVFCISLTELLKSDEVDGVLTIQPVTTSPLHQDLNIVDMVAQSRQQAGNARPVAMWPYMDVESFVDAFEAIERVACFDTIEQAVQGLSFCYRYHQIKNRRVPAQKRFSFDGGALESLLQKGRDQKVLVGEEALQFLNLFGIPVVKGAIAKNRGELEAAASALRYPIVLKLAGRAFLHKSEWGGVITGINDPDSLLRSYDRLAENVKRHDPHASIDMVQLQEQLRGQELLLGLKRDPQFGHVIACGLGGIYTEVFRDISRAMVPLDEREAEEMLLSLKIYPLLKGTRGEAGVHWPALIDAMVRLSFLATEVPDIAELDINPLMASADGATAVDARILW